MAQPGAFHFLGGQVAKEGSIGRLSGLGYALGILAGLLLHVLVLCALSGEATAFAAPLAVAIATRVSDRQKWGMAAILVFLSVGLVGLSFVREERAEAV